MEEKIKEIIEEINNEIYYATTMWQKAEYQHSRVCDIHVKRLRPKIYGMIMVLEMLTGKRYTYHFSEGFEGLQEWEDGDFPTVLTREEVEQWQNPN